MSSLKPILWLSLALPTVPQGLANGYVARKSLPLGRFIKNSLPARRCYSSVSAQDMDPVTVAKIELERVAGTVLRSRKTGELPVSEALRTQVKKAADQLVKAREGPVSLSKLPGLWNLDYTTAPDVLSIFALEKLPFSPIKIGKIYQKYSTPTSNADGELQGNVSNIVKFSIPPLTDEENGLTFSVGARYYPGSDDVAIAFETASVSSLKLSALAEGLVAPAVLPRMEGLKILSRLSKAEIKVPLVAPSSVITTASRAAGKLRIVFVDEDILVGEAFSGLFVFRREAQV
uniref:Plastid lipid-associated protein/fibrillin conserved domain-containing protein n=1 Tax=Amorphochlora amoebiformis TaxID=1561963 RepID=A0A7S0CZX1_9EUKA|mmetsp:Transcript_15506/g.24555  ORF Transcript_15506/g.24555 Transcript_15506/m.24555 type:complete len:289 (+) Transcript_15506:29-895(+)